MESSHTTISINLAQRQTQDGSPSIFCGMKAVNSDIEVVEGNVVGAIVNASTSMRLLLLGSGLVDGDYVLELETFQKRSFRILICEMVQLRRLTMQAMRCPKVVFPTFRMAVASTLRSMLIRTLLSMQGGFCPATMNFSD